ncbi:MAG: amino acid ABC transporter permease [Propionibacteriaceae bacterium]|nr:amino acid ABC transporter permease [Propionibacteriaceae bacterium]
MSDVTTTAVRRKLSPRKKAWVAQGVQYAILVAVVILAVININGQQVVNTFLRADLIESMLGWGLAHAFLNTIVYTVGAFIFGLLLGTVLAMMKLSSVGPYRWISNTYTEFFRGIPALIVLMCFSLIGVALPGFEFPSVTLGEFQLVSVKMSTVWMALGMVSAAYMSETIRAGIQAVPKGQMEAARALGMPSGMAMFRIVLPQAFRIVIPPLTNELILLTKDSSLIYMMGLAAGEYELTKFGRDLANSHANITPLFVAGLLYLIITLPLSALVRWMERRSDAGKK